MYSRGMGDGPCQVPQPGVAMIFPPCAASAPIGSGIPAASYTSQPPPASYVAPILAPAPACTQDTRPGGAAFSDACISQVLQNQQQNFQLSDNANYQVDLANCLNTFPQPPDCYQRTFGLTPAGGFTSDARPQGVQTVLDSSGRVVSGPPVSSSPASNPPAPHPPAPASTPPVFSPASSPLSSPPPAGSGPTTNYVPLTDQAAAVLGGSLDVGGFNLPVWGIAAAAAGLLFFLGGRR